MGDILSVPEIIKILSRVRRAMAASAVHYSLLTVYYN